MTQKTKRQLLIEGYKAMAKEHEEFALLAEEAAREVVPDWQDSEEEGCHPPQKNEGYML